MNWLEVSDNKFVYCTQKEKKVMLNCMDYISNKSRVPMHSESGLTIPNLLLALLKLHSKISEGTGEEERSQEYLLMDIILVAELIKTSQPVKVLELGCTNGILSYHLSTMIGKFHEKSTLCCICDVIGNNSGNRWLDMAAAVEEPPNLSMMAGDYNDTNLKDGCFDLVFINGSDFYEEPYKVIKEAERLVKKHGRLICYVRKQPLLASCFQLIFSDREEYSLSVGNIIMAVQYNGLSWNNGHT